METEDVPITSTPEWRPRSSMSESTEKSSIVLPSHLLAPGKRIASRRSSERSSRPEAKSDAPEPALDLAPWEVSICDRLTRGIRALHATNGQSEERQDAALSFVNLETALRYAASTIQYHAKWFSDDGLAALLEVSLNAAASSTASAELFAAVHLVHTITIYSLLPSQSLPVVAKFLSQTSYAATRAHKTNKLANATWSTLQNILESHLGNQMATALLDIIGSGDETMLESRAGYAQFAGALTIVSNKLLPHGDGTSTFPSISFTQLVDALWSAVVNGTDSVRELIMETLNSYLSKELTARDLDERSTWDALLDTVEPCVTLTPDSSAAISLVETLISKREHFEPRNIPVLANLAIDMNLPLTAELAAGMLPIWEEVLPTRDIPNAFARLLTKLCRSALYTEELDALVERSILEIFLLVPTSRSLIAFIHTIQDLATDPESTDEAADILSKALVMMLRRSVRFAGRQQEQVALFRALCQMSKRSVAAAEALFKVRADVNGSVYVESGLLSHTFPAHSEASSMSAVMHDASALPLEEWHEIIITVLQGCVDWKIYHYFLCELPSLLGNHPMFDERIGFVKNIIMVVSDLLDNGVYPELPIASGLTKSEVTVALLQIMTSVLSYHQHLSKQESLGVVSKFLSVAGSRDYTVSIACIHALTICCYELPDLMTSYMDDIIDKMSKLVTQRYLAIHALLFLAGLSRQPKLFHNFQTHDFKKIFGVCGSYLRSIRGTSALTERVRISTSDQSSSNSGGSTNALPQYVYALAHHVIAFWYLALRSQDRLVMKEHITSFLKYAGADGSPVVEDQGLVTIDLMDRVDATDLEHDPAQHFEEMDGRTVLINRLSGVILLTTETALRTGRTVLTVRRPTGTEKGVLKVSPSDPATARHLTVSVDGREEDFICVFPADTGGCTYGKIFVPGPTSVLGSKTTLTLPNNDESVTRAIQQFDRTFALDSHKAGVIYIGDGQTTEDEILQNCMGSPDYVEFVMDLGTLKRLKNASFNPQGLDRIDDADGQHTIVWQNSLTELVFHITTFMPNNVEGDISLNTANKKKHIGNDYVNIIFNNSGALFNFDTFPSQFNFVYIVITPAARTSFIQTRLQSTTEMEAMSKKDRFYAVQVLTRPGYPAVSSAAEEKIVSGASLPQYVRNLALNECILALMWAYRDEPGEYPSSWRSRLGQIRRMWERYGT